MDGAMHQPAAARRSAPRPDPRPDPRAGPGVDDAAFRAMVEGAHDIITVLGPDGRIHYDNPAVHAVLGYAQGELVGRNAFELVHPADYPVALALLVDLVANPGACATLAFRFWHKEQ